MYINMQQRPCNIVVFGASGDLAKRKVYPALHSMFAKGTLPSQSKVFGYARTQYDDDQFFHKHVASMLTRPIHPGFRERCKYISGQYDDMSLLQERLGEIDDGGQCNRLFYLSLPPVAVPDVIKTLPLLFSPHGWNRVIIEKPFGNDMASFFDLMRLVKMHIPEDSLYLVDHYLGKSIVEHIRTHPIKPNRCMDVLFIEPNDVEGRAYFDQSGIVRDFVQNHVLQVVATILQPQNKLEALQDISSMAVKDTFPLGQFDPYPFKGSVTPTYIDTCVSYRDTIRIRIRAGKGFEKRLMCINIDDGACTLDIDSGRITFHHSTDIDVGQQDAYEIILCDALKGDKCRFVSMEEVQESWRIVESVMMPSTPDDLFIYQFGCALDDIQHVKIKHTLCE